MQDFDVIKAALEHQNKLGRAYSGILQDVVYVLVVSGLIYSQASRFLNAGGRITSDFLPTSEPLIEMAESEKLALSIGLLVVLVIYLLGDVEGRLKGMARRHAKVKSKLALIKAPAAGLDDGVDDGKSHDSHWKTLMLDTMPGKRIRETQMSVNNIPVKSGFLSRLIELIFQTDETVNCDVRVRLRRIAFCYFLFQCAMSTSFQFRRADKGVAGLLFFVAFAIMIIVGMVWNIVRSSER